MKLNGKQPCRRCGEGIKYWNGWELCDACGHRHHITSGWHDPIPEAAPQGQEESK